MLGRGGIIGLDLGKFVFLWKKHFNTIIWWKYIFRSARTSWNTFVRPSVRPSVRGRKKSGSTVQLYKSTKDHCQPIRYCLVRVWWCLVVSGGVWISG